MSKYTHSETASQGRLRLGYLDGIRGLAALYVLLFHSLYPNLDRADQTLSFPMQVLRAVFGYGHFGVSFFIVLSGFSLMLPIARAGAMELSKGFGHYIKRRARRIMPAYYAALLLSIAAIVAGSVLFDRSPEDGALSTGSVLSHLFLVHNLNFEWAFRINGPMWSVATEWQIYFLFPFVLMPLWRRFGPVVTVAVAWAVPLIVHFTVPFDQNLDWAAPWFVGSFALGMWAAVAANQSEETLRRPWGPIGLGCLAFLVFLLAGPGSDMSLALLDLLVSVMAVALILTCTARLVRETGASTLRPVTADESFAPGRLNALLSSGPMLSLGAFSYSLYLLQHPMLRLSEAVLDRTSLGFEAILWVQLIVCIPLIMVVARIFAEFFELPFTSGSRVLNAVLPAKRARSSADLAGTRASSASERGTS